MKQKTEVSFLPIDEQITLRRMVARSPQPQGTVLLLHGFPETLVAWSDIATELSKDLEVHAFDWPGFGQSSRPDSFSYAPSDYARLLRAYIAAAGIDTSNLTIYGTDIGALPALLLAIEEPSIAHAIIVGDFAPLDRPRYMWESLQGLKSPETSDAIRDFMNKNRDEILANVFFRGLSNDARYPVSSALKDDMSRGW
jgi:pimeloyl-ACP methyl ester carboxylesterase